MPAALREDAHLGAISFPQLVGSSLDPHYLHHVLALDGVISGGVMRGVWLYETSADRFGVTGFRHCSVAVGDHAAL